MERAPVQEHVRTEAPDFEVLRYPARRQTESGVQDIGAQYNFDYVEEEDRDIDADQDLDGAGDRSAEKREARLRVRHRLILGESPGKFNQTRARRARRAARV